MVASWQTVTLWLQLKTTAKYLRSYDEAAAETIETVWRLLLAAVLFRQILPF